MLLVALEGLRTAKELFRPTSSIDTLSPIEVIKFFNFGKPNSWKLKWKKTFFYNHWGIWASEIPSRFSFNISINASCNIYILYYLWCKNADLSGLWIELSGSSKELVSVIILTYSGKVFFTSNVLLYLIIPRLITYWVNNDNLPREHSWSSGQPQYFTKIKRKLILLFFPWNILITELSAPISTPRYRFCFIWICSNCIGILVWV